jgi:penicillin-binding protein 1A
VPRKKPSESGKERKLRGGSKKFARIILLCSVAFFSTAVYFLYDLPDMDHVKPLDTRPSIVVLADDGTLVARYGGLQGEIVTMADVPASLKDAVLSVEDRRFYSHFGIDLIGLTRAMLTNILARHWVQGGSTITQQLAKNLFLTPDKTLRRKVQEAMMALCIEHKYTKDEILLAYLNRVYFGDGAYGVDAAAKTYFNKPARKLTLYESAVLAGLLKAPSHFSPANNPDLAMARAKVVIKTMQEAGYIDARTAAQVTKNAKPPGLRAMAGDLNHYFADWVISQVDSFISDTGSDIYVKTTLDPKLQLMAESKQKSLFKKIPPKDNVTQAALVTEAPDGAVLAMIGGVDYAESQYNRATQALRQPGSSFKPFVYLAALETGFTPDTTVEDSPIKEGKYRPDNFDNEYFGTVTLATALKHSLNTATIRLLKMVGVGKMVDVATRMGFTHLPKPELSAGLGADEVNLLELTNAYAIIANGGTAVWPYAVLSIKDGAGNLLYQRTAPSSSQVFTHSDIANLDSMLMGDVERGGTGEAAKLSHGHTAGKTGTTQNYRDAWFLGYSDRLITGVWMGNDDGSSMHAVTGGKYPAQLWHNYMEEVINFNTPVFVPEAAQPLVPADSEFSGMLNRWSSTSDDSSDGFKGSDVPVYNR